MTERIKRSGIDRFVANAISERLIALGLAHEIIVGVQPKAQPTDVTHHLTFGVVVHKKRLKDFWVRQLQKVADETGARVHLSEGRMEFR